MAADSPLIEDAAEPAQALHLLRTKQGPRHCQCSSGPRFDARSEIGKLVKLLEARKAVLDDDDDETA